MPEALPNLETLQYDAELFVFRSMRAGEPLLVVEPAATEVAASIAQFENAVRLRGAMVSLQQKPLSAAEAPESIFNYVVRTGDSVVLETSTGAS